VIPIRAHVVALTFDAGANADGLPAILSVLRTRDIPATFFLTGNFVRSYPVLSAEIARDGFRLGDHSVDHPYFTHLGDSQIRSEGSTRPARSDRSRAPTRSRCSASPMATTTPAPWRS
jgi:peptidoglycan/xylan/chitin deacetylase (PgdA/CDA1 family)